MSLRLGAEGMFRTAARIFIAVWWFATAQTALAEKRVALVIGNSAYSFSDPLPNPENDADDVAAALRRLHFEVTEEKDLTVSKFDRAVDAFEKAAKGADVALFFFSGHGVQIDKRGYLAPVNVKLETESSALRELVAIQEVISRIENAARMSVIVLDACRNSGLQERLRRIAIEKNRDLIPPKGLPPVAVRGSDTLVVYATAPGETASDGEGRNSPFTAALLKNIETPGLEIELMFKQVTADVLAATGTQQPERLSRLQRALVLSPAKAQSPDEVAALKERLARLEAELQKKQQPEVPSQSAGTHTAVAAPQWHPSDGACDGLLVSVASGARPCIKPGSGQGFKDCPECPEMVVAPAGSFMMGSPKDEPERRYNEGPQHKVTIAKPFAVGRFAVTFEEWDACVAGGGCGGYRPRDEGWGRGNRPVINVNLDDAKAYAAWLSKKTGQHYLLLSEAEFEYVARAGTITPFWWGTPMTPEQANYNANIIYAGGGSKGVYRAGTVPAKSFETNPWGLYQVHGNAWNWVEDCWHDTYEGAPADGSARTTTECKQRVLRGGSWLSDPALLRAASRVLVNLPKGRSNDYGFRVARTLNP